MKCQEIHDSIINRARSQNRVKLKRTNTNYVYYERHHIIPECFFIERVRKGPKGWLDGDPNEPNNLVLLTGREHFIIHLLLVKIYKQDDKIIDRLIHAAHMLTTDSNDQRINNKRYDWLKTLYSSACSRTKKGKPTWNKNKKGYKVKPRTKEYCKNLSVKMTGRKKTPEHCENISKALKGNPKVGHKGEKNPMYGKGDRQRGEKNHMWGKKAWNNGLQCSDSTKKKIGKKNKDRRWITNGLENKMIEKWDKVSEGYILGRIHHTKLGTLIKT